MLGPPSHLRHREWVSSFTILIIATLWRETCESRQICRGHPLSLHNFYCKCIAKKWLIWKMKCPSNEAQHLQWCHSMANIKTNFYTGSHCFQDINVSNVWCWKFRKRSQRGNICSDAIQWRIPTSVKAVAHIFTLDVTISEMLMFHMFILENLHQSDWVQHACYRSNSWFAYGGEIIVITSRVMMQCRTQGLR